MNKWLAELIEEIQVPGDWVSSSVARAIAFEAIDVCSELGYAHDDFVLDLVACLIQRVDDLERQLSESRAAGK